MGFAFPAAKSSLPHPIAVNFNQLGARMKERPRRRDYWLMAGGTAAHTGARPRHVPKSADEDGEDAATAGPPRDCDLGADENTSYGGGGDTVNTVGGGDPDEGEPDGLAGLRALPRPTGLNGLGAAEEDLE